MRRRFIPRQGSEWTARSLNVRVACSGDIDEVVAADARRCGVDVRQGNARLDVARIDRTFAETFVLRSELLVASCSDGIVGCCTLSAEDPGVLARRPSRGGRISAQARGATDTCGPGCQLRADRGLPPCRANAGVRQAAARLPPEPAWPIRAARIHPTSTLSIPAGIQPSSQNA